MEAKTINRSRSGRRYWIGQQDKLPGWTLLVCLLERETTPVVCRLLIFEPLIILRRRRNNTRQFIPVSTSFLAQCQFYRKLYNSDIALIGLWEFQWSSSGNQVTIIGRTSMPLCIANEGGMSPLSSHPRWYHYGELERDRKTSTQIYNLYSTLLLVKWQVTSTV